jgi:hypothetical protein
VQIALGHGYLDGVPAQGKMDLPHVVGMDRARGRLTAAGVIQTTSS